MANPLETPKAIFVSTVKTDPLEGDMQFILKDKKKKFQLGIDLLNKLVDQNVFLGIEKSFSGYFNSIERVQHYTIQGPHPVGNISLHIQKICPINMGEVVWTVNAEDVVNLGENTEFDLKKEQLLHNSAKVNLSSNEVKILKLLINNSHQYLTRDLLNTELGLDFLSRSGDMQISRLRLKLKKECNLEDLIRSVHGKGYKIFL